MFTGIIEHPGVVLSFESKDDSALLRLKSDKLFQEVKNGDSVAVNGACLTVIEHKNNEALFELGPQTLEKTNLSELKTGDEVNLELPLRLQDRLGGHFVQGHVDATGEILSLTQKGETAWLEIAIPKAYEKYLTPQGSIAVDGISLTIARLDANVIGIMLMEYTMEKTNLKHKKQGDRLNLEFDMLSKMVSSMLVKN